MNITVTCIYDQHDQGRRQVKLSGVGYEAEPLKKANFDNFGA